jgi:hypothetical protein
MVVEGAQEGELDDHLGCGKHAPTGRDGGNSRNGHGAKTVLTGAGPVEITVPRDRDSSFEPVIVAKRQRRLSWRANWLRSADLAAAAAAGHAALEVARRPVAAIIPTGDEIQSIGSALGRATSPTATLSCLPCGPGRPAPGPWSATFSPTTRTRWPPRSGGPRSPPASCWSSRAQVPGAAITRPPFSPGPAVWPWGCRGPAMPDSAGCKLGSRP